MKKRIIKLLKKKFVRNILVMATGTIAAQLITMLLSPVITRMYGPEAFGIMGTFTAMLNIVIPIVALTYPAAIVLPKSNLDARGLVHLSLIITIIMSVISLIIIVLFYEQILNIFSLDEIANYLYLIPLVVIFSGLLQVVEQWLIRTKQFTISARVTFYQSLIVNGSKVGVGFLNPVAAVLVFITAFGNGIKALMMIIYAKKSNYPINNDERKEIKDLKKLAKEYYDFPFFRAPEVFLNGISQGLPVLILTAFFGPASAGYYTIGRTVLNLPTQLIGKSVGDVFYPRIAEAKNNNENLTQLIKKATIALAGVGVLPFGLIIFFGPDLFSFVFGSDWVVAGEYARWIALWTFFMFINRPSVRSLPVLDAQRFHLIYTFFMLISRVGVLAVGYYIFASDIVSIALFSITGAILNIGLIVFTIKISKKRTHNNKL